MTDHLYNPGNLPYDSFPQGELTSFLEWAESLPVREESQDSSKSR